VTLKRVIVVSVAVTTLASSAFASAASLGGITGGSVGAGEAAIPACDTTGVSVSYTTTGGTVTTVTVGGLADPGCEGGALSLTLTNTAGDSIASGGPQTIPTDGDTADNSVNVSVSPNPAAENVAGYHVSIAGP
jgi:hypothetical protein